MSNDYDPGAGTPAFQHAVERLKQLDGTQTLTAFEMGDIVLEQAPWGDGHAHNGAEIIVRRLAEEAGIKFETLLDRRRVAAAIPDWRRLQSIAYSVFQEIAHRAPVERERLLELVHTAPPPTKCGRWTVDAVRCAQGRRPTRYPPPDSDIQTEAAVLVASESPEARRAILQQLAADPDIVTEAASLGSPVSRALSDLYRRSDAVRQEHHEQRTQADPLLKRLDEIGAALDIEKVCSKFAEELARLSERFARDVNRALPRTAPPAADGLHVMFVRRSVAQARAALDAVEGYVQGNDTDLDAFLADVLDRTR